MVLRRTGFVATLGVGLGLLGLSLHGMTAVDQALKVAAATPGPGAQPHLVREERVGPGPAVDPTRPWRDCERWREHGRGEV
jgi:hypothetical protein